MLESWPRRLLPFVLPILPDEPIDSWFDAFAASYRATAIEMADAVGLSPPSGPLDPHNWSRALTTAQLSSLQQVTGLSSDALIQATRTGFTANILRVDRQGSPQVFAGGTGKRARFCPDCLTDSGGRWRLTWEYDFAFACSRHRRLLVDRCPKCRMAPARHRYRKDHVPTPGRCPTPEPGGIGAARSRCGYDLTRVVPGQPADDTVLAAQRRIQRTIASGHSAQGMYASSPPPAIQVLEDLRLLRTLARRAAEKNHHLPGLDLSLLTAAVPAHRRRSENDWTPQELAAAHTIAWQALQRPELALTLIRGRIHDFASFPFLTPQLQAVTAVAQRRTHRVVVPRAVSLSTHPPAARAAKIPALFWDEWADVLAPMRRERDAAKTALSAAIVHAGASLTHVAAAALLDPLATAHVASAMRSLGQGRAEARTPSLIDQIVRSLDTHRTPIDYTRRRNLDYTHVLPEADWTLLLRACGHTSDDNAWAYAHAFLYRCLTGSSVLRAPVPPGMVPAHTDDVDRFAAEIPDLVLTGLIDLARRFLRANHITEPVMWSPPLPPALQHHNALPTIRTPPNKDAPPGTRARHRLREHPGISQQPLPGIVARPVDASVPTHSRMPDLPESWLRTKYETEFLTVQQIALLAGCVDNTITRRLAAAGIARRTLAHTRRLQRTRIHPLAGRFPLLARTLVGQQALRDAYRFLITTEASSLRDAARMLGLTRRELISQMDQLAARAGAPLFTGTAWARRTSSDDTLTSLGRQLRSALRRADIQTISATQRYAR